MKKKSTLLSFIPRYKPYIKELIFDMFCSLIYASCGIVVPLVVRELLYQGLAPSSTIDFKYIILLGSIILALKVLTAVASYLVSTVGHVMGAKIESDLRKDLFNKYMALPHAFYSDTKVGTLMSRISSDLFEVTELSHHCPEEFLMTIIQVVGSFIILGVVHINLTLIIFALLPFMVWFSVVYNKKMRRAFMEQREQVGEINAQVEDSLSGIRVVKSFANEDVEKCKFAKNNLSFLSIKRRTYKYMGISHSGVRLFNGLMYFLTVVFGCLFIINQTLTTVDLVAFLLYTETLLKSIERIIEFTEQFQLGMTGIERFNQLMAEDDKIYSPKDAITPSKIEGNIRFDNVTFKYESDQKEVISHINLTINKGETVALVGPSGSGKTTICNLIPRFYDVTDGGVFVDDIDVRKIDLNVLRKNIGVVQQDVYLFYGSVRENISYGKNDATLEEIIDAAKKAGAHDFIESLPNGYDTIVGERGIKLSGGQKQRISIARVFLKNPPITLLDEATSSLDTESEKLVQHSLEELSKERTTFIIAHRLSTIKNADKIIVLTEKGIEEMGTHQELMEKQGVYYKLYSMWENYSFNI